MKNLKRNLLVVTVLLFVCAAVGLNWSYKNRWGDGEVASYDADKVLDASYIEDSGTQAAGDAGTAVSSNDYFASARLTREQSRDETKALLENAAASDTASQEIIDSAMSDINAMAVWSMQEAQLENLLVAKEFDDCVVFISGDGVTVAVPAPEEGLGEMEVARITDAVTSETDFTASQINVIEIK